MEKNGYVKWFQLIWIVGILILALTFLGKNVIANENKNISRYGELKDCIFEYIIPIREGIAELKTEVKNLSNASLSK